MVKKWSKRLLILMASLLLLVVALVLFLHTSWGKSIVRNKAEKFLQNTLQSSVKIGSVDYRLPNWIQLKNVVFFDKRNDTLLSTGNIYVKIDMIKLLSNKVEVGKIELEDVTASIYRTEHDSLFNYQFILDAFSTDSDEPSSPSSGGSTLTIAAREIHLRNIRYTHNDNFGKQYYSAYL